MHIAALAALAALAAALGLVCTYIAAQRTVAQPTGAHPDAEAALIGAVLAEPSVFRLVVAVEPDMFTWAPHRALWAELFDLAVDDNDPVNVAEAESHGLPSLMLPFNSSELVARLRSEGLLDGVSERALAAEPLTRKQLLAVGAKVLEGTEDRSVTGLAPVEAGTSAAAPLVRTYRAPSVRRRVVAVVWAAAAMALVAATGAGVFAVAAAAVLIAGSVVTALVDLDTLYVDHWATTAMAVSGGGFAVAAAGEQLAGNVLLAAVSTVSIVGGLELVAFVWGRVRNRVGLGGGDSLVLVPLLAVPVLCTGVAETALWGLLAALVLAVAGQCTLIALGRATRDSHFPLVPYLVCGWPLGWYLAVTFGAV